MSFGIKTNHEKSFWASDGIANKFAAVESTKNTTHPYFGTLGRYFKVTSCDVAIIRPDFWIFGEKIAFRTWQRFLLAGKMQTRFDTFKLGTGMFVNVCDLHSLQVEK